MYIVNKNCKKYADYHVIRLRIIVSNLMTLNAFYSFMISDYRRDNDQTEDIVCIDLSGSTPRTLR